MQRQRKLFHLCDEEPQAPSRSCSADQQQIQPESTKVQLPGPLTERKNDLRTPTLKGDLGAEDEDFAVKSNPETLETDWFWDERKLDVRINIKSLVCGYDTNARQDGKKPRERLEVDVDNWRRRAPYDFTSCLAHSDITAAERRTGTVILRIIGHFEHNEECQKAMLVRAPAIPLHPHVVEVAMRQLWMGASITSIQSENAKMFKNIQYHDQTTFAPTTANCRYEVLPTDFSRLYRRYNRETFGLDITIPPEKNLDAWLDRDSTHYRPDISKAIAFYSARTCEQERLKVCICTHEMREAAWKYVHGKQLVLDGTFGLCTSRLLLFIALGVDENNKGFPVALFLFSAPTGNRATHAGYDTSILAELLGVWRDHMGRRDGILFAPKAAMTDTDPKERGALIIVWPLIILLLCRFHTRQCWTNKRNTLLPKADSIWRGHVRKRLLVLEEVLLETISHDTATQLILSEQRAFEILASNPDPEAKKIASAGLEFVQYLTSTWMPTPLWKSWSKAGKISASQSIGIGVEFILTTTNHLEALNGRLKKKHLPQWQNSGHRLRFDILIYHLIFSIIPLIYARHRMLSDFQSWKSSRFASAAGNLPLQTVSKRRSLERTNLPPRAWYTPDTSRDSAAERIRSMPKYLQPFSSHRPFEYWAVCKSSSNSSVIDGQFVPMQYWLTMHPSGAATCTCPDWLQRGGACKHLRAFRLLVQDWSVQCDPPLNFRFPTSPEEAAEVEIQNKRWYGYQYAHAITSPAVAEVLSLSGDRNVPLHMRHAGDVVITSAGNYESETVDAPDGLLSAGEHTQQWENSWQRGTT
ncbi:hypothetical protein EUX98_g9541 [Antrodiella citrinella]|uniref:SWIM-type domain-containing protein n=1 Tax=Antrodiella citrinella TaxID=2447956 RepID=A0A4S4LRZ8_9APHY|nr:hypothetical protein EUX98_g9541 [Antrodiella citrinella]